MGMLSGIMDTKHRARRREAATVRKEAAAEAKQLNNARISQRLKDREAKNEIRRKEGGVGFKVTFFNKGSRKRRRLGIKKKIRRTKKRTNTKRTRQKTKRK